MAMAVVRVLKSWLSCFVNDTDDSEIVITVDDGVFYPVCFPCMGATIAGIIGSIIGFKRELGVGACDGCRAGIGRYLYDVIGAGKNDVDGCNEHSGRFCRIA